MCTKYHLDLYDHITVNDITLYRIIADKRISKDIKKGDRGGYIESYKNLSELDKCWVYDNARVYGNATVKDDTKIRGNAKVHGNACIEGCSDIYDEVVISENAKISNSNISGNSTVFGNAKVYNSTLCGISSVRDNAFINDFTRLTDTTVIGGKAEVRRSTIKNSFIKDSVRIYNSDVDNAVIKNGTEIINGGIRGDKDIAFVSGFGRKNRNTTFYRSKGGYLMVICGCFCGIIDEFENQVRETYIEEDGKMNPLGEEYMDIANLMRKRFERIGIKTDNNEKSLVDILYEAKKSDKSHPEEDGGKQCLYLDFSSTE